MPGGRPGTITGANCSHFATTPIKGENPYTMRPLIVFFSSGLLLACNQKPAPAAGGGQPGNMEKLRARVSGITGNSYGPADKVQAALRVETGQQARGQSFRKIPIPADGYPMPAGHKLIAAHWQQQPDGKSYRAPGLTVYPMPGAQYMFTQGPMADLFARSGAALRAPITVEQVVQQDLVPRLQREGFTLARQQRIPAVEALQQQFMDLLARATGSPAAKASVALSEWTKPGQHIAVLTTQLFFNGDPINWSYSCTRLEADPDRYEDEKAAWLHGESNVEYNPAFFTAFAQVQQQKMQRSWSAHNQRMRVNQAAFDARQRAHADMVDGVNNAIMGGYNHTSATMDRMQNSTINGIRGEQDAINPYTGEAGKVQAGQDQYWMNRDGQYIGTNDVMYDPNVNSDHTDQWRQLPTGP